MNMSDFSLNHAPVLSHWVANRQLPGLCCSQHTSPFLNEVVETNLVCLSHSFPYNDAFSDMDFVFQILPKLNGIITENRSGLNVAHVTAILQARVPIVRLVYSDGVKIDVSCSNRLVSTFLAAWIRTIPMFALPVDYKNRYSGELIFLCA